MHSVRRLFTSLILLVVVSVIGFAGFRVVSWFWFQLRQLETPVSVGILSAMTTVLVATLTVALGRYYERKKDIEAAYRQRKTEIYDEFLKEMFRVFYGSQETRDGAATDALVEFLREWQRKIVLWGGQDVLVAYVDWMRKLKAGNADAEALFKTDGFFRAIRADLGHSNIPTATRS